MAYESAESIPFEYGWTSAHVRDRLTSTTEVLFDYLYRKVAASISADGRFVAFRKGDVFVYDRQTGTDERVNVDSARKQLPAESETAITADGRYVAFTSGGDVYVRDHVVDTTELASFGFDLGGGQVSISADGRFVTFVSGQKRLDVLLRDRDPFVNDLLIDFGPQGLWERVNDATWQKIRKDSPQALASGDLNGDGRFEPIGAFW